MFASDETLQPRMAAPLTILSNLTNRNPILACLMLHRKQKELF
jgi:hypothetical protein